MLDWLLFPRKPLIFCRQWPDGTNDRSVQKRKQEASHDSVCICLIKHLSLFSRRWKIHVLIDKEFEELASNNAYSLSFALNIETEILMKRIML